MAGRCRVKPATSTNSLHLNSGCCTFLPVNERFRIEVQDFCTLERDTRQDKIDDAYSTILFLLQHLYEDDRRAVFTNRCSV